MIADRSSKIPAADFNWKNFLIISIGIFMDYYEFFDGYCQNHLIIFLGFQNFFELSKVSKPINL